MIEWTQDALAKLSTDALNSLRHNASKHGNQEVVGRCDAELARRKPVKPARTKDVNESREGHYVSEFHFVCPNDWVSSEIGTGLFGPELG
jgi:hypothetical protein